MMRYFFIVVHQVHELWFKIILSVRHCLQGWLAGMPFDGAAGPGAADRFIHTYMEKWRNESRRRLQAAIDRDLALEERLKSKFASECAQTEAFLLAEDDPLASALTRRERRSARAAMVFIESYREQLPHCMWAWQLLESTIEVEQAMLVWRQRHARMVERMIGRRPGTGGSSGVDYLDQTALRYRVFSDLWTVRSLPLRPSGLPDLEAFADHGVSAEEMSP